MVNRKKLGLRLHGITTRYTPALWALSVWIAMVPALSRLTITDPATWFATMGFVLAGGVFIYDALVIWPEKGKIIGLTSAVIIAVLGVANIVLGIMIFLGIFNPFVGNSPWTPFAIVTLGFGVVATLVAGTMETILGKHYGKALKEKLGGR